MANIAKGWAIGDTVWVWRHDNPTMSLMFTPISKVVRNVDMTSSANSATVYFTDGTYVIDGPTIRVFTTETLACTAIIDAVIAAIAPVVVTEVAATTFLVRGGP